MTGQPTLCRFCQELWNEKTEAEYKIQRMKFQDEAPRLVRRTDRALCANCMVEWLGYFWGKVGDYVKATGEWPSGLDEVYLMRKKDPERKSHVLNDRERIPEIMADFLDILASEEDRNGISKADIYWVACKEREPAPGTYRVVPFPEDWIDPCVEFRDGNWWKENKPVAVTHWLDHYRK